MKTSIQEIRSFVRRSLHEAEDKHEIILQLQNEFKKTGRHEILNVLEDALLEEFGEGYTLAEMVKFLFNYVGIKSDSAITQNATGYSFHVSELTNSFDVENALDPLDIFLVACHKREFQDIRSTEYAGKRGRVFVDFDANKVTVWPG